MEDPVRWRGKMVLKGAWDQDRLPVVYVDLYVAKINLVVMWPRKTFSLRLFQAT